MGASASCAKPIVDQLADAFRNGYPALVWSDGEDVTAVIGEAGEKAHDVTRTAAKIIGENHQ